MTNLVSDKYVYNSDVRYLFENQPTFFIKVYCLVCCRRKKKWLRYKTFSLPDIFTAEFNKRILLNQRWPGIAFGMD